MTPAVSERLLVTLSAPAMLALLGLAFVWAWTIDRKRHYLLLLTGACLSYALGAATQILWIPPDSGHNAMVSSVFYTTGVLLFCEGVLRRSHHRLGIIFDVAAFAIVMELLWFFFYVAPSTLARVYIQNFGYGLILLVTAIRLAPLSRGRNVDRALFWGLLLFALHFFPRTLLTIGFDAPIGPRAFGLSLFWQVLNFSLAVFGAGLGLTLLVAVVTDVMDDLRRERDTDPLSGVFNRRGFEERAEPLLSRSTNRPLCLILCDLDHFKSINDRYGHGVGDDVLRSFGLLLKRTVRTGDLVGRIGGEEFAALLPDSTLGGAFDCAERLRLQMQRTSFDPVPSVTASFGVVAWKPGESLGGLMKRADRLLYAAKEGGRNRTMTADGRSVASTPLG